MTTQKDHWMTAYEEAYQRANGGAAKVVICGGGWYRIAPLDGNGSNHRIRKSEVILMTARLEQRADEQEANTPQAHQG